jgi:hypothetical protein
VVPAAEVVAAPPDDLPPAVAGALVAKRVERGDLAATLADLGRRGVLRVAPIGAPRSGRAHDFSLVLVGSRASLAPFERPLLDALFGPGSTPRRTQVRLSEVRISVAAVRPEVVRLVGDELVRHGFFATRPARIHVLWQAVGAVLVALGVLGFWAAIAASDDEAAAAWWMPALTLLALGVLIWGVGRVMPPRTPAGAAAQWRRFARSLATLDRIERRSAGRELFEGQFERPGAQMGVGRHERRGRPERIAKGRTWTKDDGRTARW